MTNLLYIPTHGIKSTDGRWKKKPDGTVVSGTYGEMAALAEDLNSQEWGGVYGGKVIVVALPKEQNNG